MRSFIKNLCRASWVPRLSNIIVFAFSVLLTILFYALRSNVYAMDGAAIHISAPARWFLGLISSVFPFSITEVLIAFAIIWLFYYVIKTIVVIVRSNMKLKVFVKRLLTIATVVLYAWGLFCWLWNSGYHAPGFGAKNGFARGGVTVEDLTAVTTMFADKANELAPLMKRDDDGHYIGDIKGFFEDSPFVYRNISEIFPTLEGSSNRPKPMLFSWLMSRTGYTGMYFALTGEANVNINSPASLLPVTISHEMAHQRGIFSEDEASFVGILAAVTSEFPVYEYAGYLSGLMYLRSALFSADFDAWEAISESLCHEVNTDLRDYYDYWASQRTVNVGVEFFDNLLTSMTETLSDTVDSVYDEFLKSQNQELGLRSYGACVDLLVEYFRE